MDCGNNHYTGYLTEILFGFPVAFSFNPNFAWNFTGKLFIFDISACYHMFTVISQTPFGCFDIDNSW